MKLLATIVCGLVIIGLFWLDRNGKKRPSSALWIPLTWFTFAASRPLGNWLSLGTHIDVGSVSANLSEGSPVDRALGTVLMVLGLMVLFRRSRALASSLRYCWPILLFLAYCAVSIAWSDFPDVAVKRLIREIGELVMILVVWTDPHPIPALKRLLARMSYTLIPLSILFCRYYPFGRTYGTWTGILTYTGVTEDKNGLATLCLLFGTASLWQLFTLSKLDPRRSGRVAVHVSILVMAVYLFALADSVTARSCMALVIIVLLALRSRLLNRVPVLVHFLMFAVVAVPAWVTLFGVGPALQAMGRDATLTDRTLIWQWVIKLVPNQWLGTGYASFWLGPRLDTMIREVTHTWIPYQAHDGYLEIYINLGWIGVGLLALIILHAYFRLIRGWRQRRAASDLMLAYFLVGVISNITEATFFRPMLIYWLFFMLAVTMPPIQEEEVFSEPATISSGKSQADLDDAFATPYGETRWQNSFLRA